MRAIAWLSVFSLVSAVSAQTSLVLKNAFIEANKNKATMDINLEVDHVLSKPHKIQSGGNDGDIHMSGRSGDVALPLVAEIMNAGSDAEQAVLGDAEAADGGNTVAVSGVWRVWFEHPGGDQVQGEHVPAPTDTNPDHVFEIHPVTKFGGDSASNSFVPIPGYTAYDGGKAFPAYEALQATIQATDTATTISASKAGYNYAQFIIQLASAPTPSDDGGFLVLAKVMADPEDPLIDDLRRMVFAPNTPPAAAVVQCQAGAQLHVLGIPRVNLERVSFMTAQHSGEAFQAQLPYEMIVVGIFDDSANACAGSSPAPPSRNVRALRPGNKPEATRRQRPR